MAPPQDLSATRRAHFAAATAAERAPATDNRPTASWAQVVARNRDLFEDTVLRFTTGGEVAHFTFLFESQNLVYVIAVPLQVVPFARSCTTGASPSDFWKMEATAYDQRFSFTGGDYADNNDILVVPETCIELLPFLFIATWLPVCPQWCVGVMG